MNDGKGLRSGSGMVLGKFMPPHLGHVHLVDFARNYVEDLTLVVGTLASEPIPGELRVGWMRELFPDARVIHLAEDLPQDPSEHSRFWDIWQEVLLRILPVAPDYVFASEEYGEKLAEVLAGRFVPVDLTRTAVPISATAIRDAPLENWRYIPTCVRPYFARKVCIFGPESVGKTTLTFDLAREFETVAVPEYARTHLESRRGAIAPSDIPQIARGQLALEASLLRQANRIAFTDTDLLTTVIWSEVLFGSCPEWIREEARKQRFDLTLLLDVDVPWVKDDVRYLPEERHSFMERCRDMLIEHGRPFVEIRGSWDQRWEAATRAVAGLLGSAAG